ncbi:hypothetical protein BDQ12DRAFT_670300 [Crucibulum laeve]|uniref:Secreted protein n=1 Tax=Crucibulum laeve TaxID=68775 RepID=A0A5C3LM85_9AGAR|nr:hypothetical protein BDQ12DRAFT_670300 [Crucibulum laeve]
MQFLLLVLWMLYALNYVRSSWDALSLRFTRDGITKRGDRPSVLRVRLSLDSWWLRRIVPVRGMDISMLVSNLLRVSELVLSTSLSKNWRHAPPDGRPSRSLRISTSGILLALSIFNS